MLGQQRLTLHMLLGCKTAAISQVITLAATERETAGDVRLQRDGATATAAQLCGALPRITTRRASPHVVVDRRRTAAAGSDASEATAACRCSKWEG